MRKLNSEQEKKQRANNNKVINNDARKLFDGKSKILAKYANGLAYEWRFEARLKCCVADRKRESLLMTSKHFKLFFSGTVCHYD